MKVFRLSKKKYCNDLSGKGAEKTGGRWNSKGTAILYTCESRALCTAEIAVHIPMGIIPENYYLSIIEIPDSVKITQISIDKLPDDWITFPHSHSTQLIGDKFIEKKNSLILKVPSAVVSGDFNFLINPDHPEFKHVKLISTESFEFDKRLFKA